MTRVILSLYVHVRHMVHISIGGSVVECSPATRAARVRFPADAVFIFIFISIYIFLLQAATQWLKNASPGIKRKYSRHDVISFVYYF